MKTRTFGEKCFVASSLVALGLSTLGTGLLAQPVVTYTVSGTSGNYTLDFTVNNTTPGTQGFDIYLFSVPSDGGVSGAPSGYNTSSFTTLHYWEIGSTQYGPFNNMWIDPTYTALPTGTTLSGFAASVTNLTPPTSVPYFAWGLDGGVIYTGSGSLNAGNPSNPFFMGNATFVVPEPTTISIVAGASLLLLFGKSRVSK